MGGIEGGDLIGTVRVLLVEDERASAMVIEQHLASIRSVRCRTERVATLAQARERLSRERYDLVLADLHLPDSAAAETIAKLVRACDHPIIALTVDEDPELRRRAIENGAFDFLLKAQLGEGSLERPVRLAALQARTLESLRRSEERFRKLTELSSDWYWEQDADFRLTFMSTLLGTTTGLNPSAHLGGRGRGPAAGRRGHAPPRRRLGRAPGGRPGGGSRSAISRCSAPRRAAAAAGSPS